ncbi:MAG: cytochrome-c oxidase, cbb3-type subunit II, partial [Planctomycetota bacterium]
LLTLRGAWHKMTTDPVIKFFVVGITFYGMATFEGPLLSIKSVNALSHYTDWTIAHVHSGALGWNGFMTFGMIYWLAPRIFQTKLHSRSLASAHFWVATLGILVYVVPLYVAGIMQGLMWGAMTPNGQLQYPTFVETTQAIIPMYYLRAIGGSLYIIGAGIGCWNIYKTWAARPAQYEVPVYEAPSLRDVAFRPERRPALQAPFPKTPVDVWWTFWWHRAWERTPFRFTFFTVLAVSAASLMELVPTFVIRSNVSTIDTVEPYTPLELAGRDLYVSEGCYNCHSQMIRPTVAETKRYGDYSLAGESVYNHPFQWGSRRIGPDLAREGGKQSHQWHVLHFRNPGDLNQGSIMPAYPWLMTKELDFESIPLRIKAMQQLGVPYPQYRGNERDNAKFDAEAQATQIAADFVRQNMGPYRDLSGRQYDLADKQVIAMIAYLQRVGTDLFRTPSSGDEEAPAEAPPQIADGDAAPLKTAHSEPAPPNSTHPKTALPKTALLASGGDR